MSWLALLAACGGAKSAPPTLIATAPPVQTFTPAPTTTPLPPASLTPAPPTAVPTSTPVLLYPSATPLPTSTTPPTATSMALAAEQVIGYSVEERPLLAYQFKNGPNHLVFVGGMHGGYEWNSAALAYEAIAYFTAHSDAIPDSVTLTIIPAANPDGLFLVTGENGRFSPESVAEIVSGEIPQEETLPGRFNANDVDLNRNWDCDWYRSAYWQDQWVSGGREPFSEPEVQALRDFFLEEPPEVVVFWHSAANGVFASACGERYPASLAAADVYGLAAGYPVYERFTAYAITGDAGDWLARISIPAITVELASHEGVDWQKNLAGMQALLRLYH